MISNKILNIKLGYNPSHDGDGYFSIYQNDKTDLTCYSCREGFENIFTYKEEFICFSFFNLNIKTLNKFFQIIEKQLKLKKKTVFYYTNSKSAVIITPSPFWIESVLRRGFFTLFLRCGAAYYKGKDIEQAINSYSLAKEAKVAVYRFLSGYTNCDVGKFQSGSVMDTVKDNTEYLINRNAKKLKGYAKFMTSMNLLKCY